MWMKVERNKVIEMMNASSEATNGVFDATIDSSSTSTEPYSVTWYGQWISLQDYDQCSISASVSNPCILYGENSITSDTETLI